MEWANWGTPGRLSNISWNVSHSSMGNKIGLTVKERTRRNQKDHAREVVKPQKVKNSSVQFSCSVVSAYLRLVIFVPAILIPACASSSPACLMMYSAYKLNKQGDNIQPWHGVITKSCSTLVIAWTVVLQLFYPWDLLGKNTGVGCHFLLLRVFPTQGSNLHLLHCRWSPAFKGDSLLTEPQGKPG